MAKPPDPNWRISTDEDSADPFDPARLPYHEDPAPMAPRLAASTGGFPFLLIAVVLAGIGAIIWWLAN